MRRKFREKERLGSDRDAERKTEIQRERVRAKVKEQLERPIGMRN